MAFVRSTVLFSAVRNTRQSVFIGTSSRATAVAERTASSTAQPKAIGASRSPEQVRDSFAQKKPAGRSLNSRLDGFDKRYSRSVSLSDVKSGKAMLQLGDRGDAVKPLQQKLSNRTDGKYVPQTAHAVDAFQKGNGLKPAAKDAGSVGLSPASGTFRTTGTSGTTPSTTVRSGKGWGGSEGVVDAAKAIARQQGIPVTSQKRTLADTQRVGSSTHSDHSSGNTNAYAADFGVSGAKGDRLAKDIARAYRIPESNIGTSKKTSHHRRWKAVRRSALVEGEGAFRSRPRRCSSSVTAGDSRDVLSRAVDGMRKGFSGARDESAGGWQSVASVSA